jgi:hypothetical protein
MTTQSLTLQDELRIENGIKLREDFVKDLMKDGKFPSDMSDREAFFRSIEGIEVSTFRRAKIRSDDQANSNQADMTAAVTTLLTKMSRKKPTSQRVNPPILDQSIQAKDVVPGEADFEHERISYDTLMPDQK